MKGTVIEREEEEQRKVKKGRIVRRKKRESEFIIMKIRNVRKKFEDGKEEIEENGK